MYADAMKNVAQIFEGINAQTFAGSRQAGEDCCRATAIVTA
jgi:hypothetical protein